MKYSNLEKTESISRFPEEQQFLRILALDWGFLKDRLNELAASVIGVRTAAKRLLQNLHQKKDCDLKLWAFSSIHYVLFTVCLGDFVSWYAGVIDKQNWDVKQGKFNH